MATTENDVYRVVDAAFPVGKIKIYLSISIYLPLCTDIQDIIRFAPSFSACQKKKTAARS